MVLRSKNAACGVSCCDQPKSICAETVCAHDVKAFDLCVGPGTAVIQGDLDVITYSKEKLDADGMPTGQTVTEGGDVYIERNLRLGGAIEVARLDVKQPLGADVLGFSVEGKTKLTGDLEVNGETVFNGDVTINGTVTLGPTGKLILSKGATVDWTGGGAAAVKWTPGSVHVNTFTPAIEEKQDQSQYQAYASAGTKDFGNTGAADTKNSLPGLTELTTGKTQVPAGAYSVDASGNLSLTAGNKLPVGNYKGLYTVTFDRLSNAASAVIDIAAELTVDAAGVTFTSGGTSKSATVQTASTAGAPSVPYEVKIPFELKVTTEIDAANVIKAEASYTTPSPWIQAGAVFTLKSATLILTSDD